jgi:hypothetical protein
MKTTDTEAIEALTATSTFGSTNTGVPVLNITKNTNLGVIQVISDAVNGTKFVALKDCDLKISVSAHAIAIADISLTKNSTIFTAATPDGIISHATLGAGYDGVVSANVKLIAGDVIRFQRYSTSTTSCERVTITATADNNATASPTQQVSSDTINFAFKATAIDPAVDAIGTFNTYTYAASGNVPTITTTAPTQSIASMNVNGVQVFTRAYNATSTAANPVRFDIMVGKGLKSRQVDTYANLLKLRPLSIDRSSVGAAEYGSEISYNESTGILSINNGVALTGSANTSREFVDYSNLAVFTSGYFVINASKSPSLVTIPSQQTVAASYWLSASFAASTTIPINFDSIEFDTHGAVTTSPTAWKFTATSASSYQVGGVIYTTSSVADFFVYKNGTIFKYIGGCSNATGWRCLPNTTIKLNKGDYIDIRPGGAITISGAALTSSSVSHIDIFKLGGY